MIIGLTWIVLLLANTLILSYQRASLPVCTIAITLLLFLLSVLIFPGWSVLVIIWLFWISIALILNIYPLRRLLLTRHIIKLFTRRMPALSPTEQAVVFAGNAGWEAQLISGMPDWLQWQNFQPPELSSSEQAFLNGPVEVLCNRIDTWKISRDLQIPEDIWMHLRHAGYFGLIIPPQFGGKGFSAYAHAEVVMKLASVNSAVATIVSVPNSLGPAELLLGYGTEEQKNYYLPRLASGAEIPCFALTSTVAGSDAGSMIDFGIIGYYQINNKEQLGICLNWNKRYITLAPVATLIGLAFKLYDPELLLGKQDYLGITCALIPVNTPGIEIGRHHNPLNCAFPNGPIAGKNVLVPLDSIIGGVEQAGRGWPMLMETLAAGRSISLPSIAVGNAKRVALSSGFYTRIRHQFHTTIANFGGVQEALTLIMGSTYWITALRWFSLMQLNQGIHSTTAAAISKYHTTEKSRQVVQAAMDIHGGKGICLGPHNYLAQLHIESPIAITVEGANILTRSLIIFGQGILRCHPFLLREITATLNPDKNQGLKEFDRALFSHGGYLISNKVRTFILGMRAKGDYFQQLTRCSATLAYIIDLVLITQGSDLKRNEKLSARIGDLWSYLYIYSAVLKYSQSNTLNSSEEELRVVQWCCEELLFLFYRQLDGLLSNSFSNLTAAALRCFLFLRRKRWQPPGDRLTSEVAQLLTRPGGYANAWRMGFIFLRILPIL